MPKSGKITIGVIALAIAFFVTGPKLVGMAMIRGFLPGAESSREVVAEKWHQTPDQHPNGRNTYWVTWTDTDIETKGNHRINLPPDQWRAVEVGDPIEIVRVSSDTPYLRDGFFASNGNFVLDGIFLLALLGGAAWGFLSKS